MSAQSLPSAEIDYAYVAQQYCCFKSDFRAIGLPKRVDIERFLAEKLREAGVADE